MEIPKAILERGKREIAFFSLLTRLQYISALRPDHAPHPKSYYERGGKREIAFFFLLNIFLPYI
jgi:hypothetical protein